MAISQFPAIHRHVAAEEIEDSGARHDEVVVRTVACARRGADVVLDELGHLVVQVVGDDILVTNPGIIARAVTDGIANAALIKVNQVGTVTETLAAMRVCRDAGWGQMVSHRSGESGDSFIADLAVSAAADIKAGAPAQARIAIYNRLTEIESTAPHLPYGPG